MSNLLLYVLFFFISLIHSSFLNYFGFDFNSLVNGNFEFTKIIFFDIISSLIIISFLVEKYLKKDRIKVYYPIILIFIIIISFISTFFSISSFISFFGNTNKAHGLVFAINLVGIFIILSNKNKNELNKFLKVFVLSLFIVFILGIKEFYLPSLNYQETINKAVSSFGNNQFLALSIILIIPLFFKKYKSKYNFLVLFFLLFVLILTKSLIGISIFLSYLCFKFLGKKKGLLFSFLGFLLGSLVVFFYFPEKLHSLFSRFYIWQNVLNLYISSFKNILFGYGFETLDLIFSKEKNPYLYIFENYGFIADRSHNLWLDILYSTGILGFSLALYITLKILKISKNTYYYDIFLLFFIFIFFNFASVVHYLFLLIILALFLKKNDLKIDKSKYKINIFYSIFIIFSIFSIIYSTKFFIAEVYYKKGNLSKSIESFNYPEYYFEVGSYNKGLKYYNNFIPLDYYKNLIPKDLNNLITNCENFVNSYPIAENYLWCGEILERENYKKESLVFYKNGLSKLPDLRNNKSIYYNNFFVKYTISGNRFFNEKYGDLRRIINLRK
ncbi:MAG: O-antigen ligase family protein [Candidatus Gracilibacteria bacterium]